jgi:hypothetical protein
VSAAEDSDCGEAGAAAPIGKLGWSDTTGEMYGADGAAGAPARRCGEAQYGWGPPPQKRKAVGGAGAATAGAAGARAGTARGGAAAQLAPTGDAARRPPRAPAQQQPYPPLPQPLPSVDTTASGGDAIAGAAGRARGPAGGPTVAAAEAGPGGAGSGGGGRDEPGYKYTAVVRGRSERDALQAVECAGCRWGRLSVAV